MKKKYFALPLAAMALFSSCEDNEKGSPEGMKMGKLELSREQVRPGEQVRIAYTSDAEEPEAVVNYLVNDELYPQDIELKDSSGYWVGHIKVPDSAQAISFNFQVNGDYESNNKKGYLLPLVNEDGEKLKGADAAIGTYYLGMGNYQGVEMEKDSVLAMMRRDLEKNPEVQKNFDNVYPFQLFRSDEEKGKEYASARIAEYEQQEDLSPSDLQNLSRLYALKKEEAKADSLENLAMEKYPKSDFAKSLYRTKFYQSKGIEKRTEVLEEYNEKIGETGEYQDFMYNYLARDYADAGELDKALEMAGKISEPSTKSSLYNSLAWNLAVEGKELETAEEISGKSIELLEAQKNDPEAKPDYYSQNQFQKSLESRIAMYQDTYALAKFKLGKVAEAAETQAKAINEHSGSDVTTRYIQYLLALENYHKVREDARKFIADNKGSEEMKNYLQTAYEETEGSMEGYEDFLADAEEEARQQTLEELKKQMLNEEAKAFSLKDLEGNTVTLQDLKGKTVILDFWATWCGPCKASFPGMQRAVTKYEDNDKVKFLFVDTMENGDTETRKERASDFIEEHDYSFHVLLDESKNEGGRAVETADAYGITGIPTKVVIGPEGNIRFKLIGYDGNLEKLVDELDMMIELIQQDQQPEA